MLDSITEAERIIAIIMMILHKMMFSFLYDKPIQKMMPGIAMQPKTDPM